MMNVQKPPKRRGPKSRWSWLKQPGTLKLAFALVRLVAEIAKLIDRF